MRIENLIANIFSLHTEQVSVFNKKCYIVTRDANIAKKIAEVAKTQAVFYATSVYMSPHYQIRFPIKRIFE